MKIIFLLPPSEWKNIWWTHTESSCFYNFDKPIDIIKWVTEKDLKCSWKRYGEAMISNTTLFTQACLPAIERYSGVMYKAIDYAGMNSNWKTFFDRSFYIFSGMYGILQPQDTIANYKLPIESKWLAWYWKENITEALNHSKADYIVNLLPGAYQKMIDFKKLTRPVININFLTNKDGKILKIAHWVKKIKWEWIKNICFDEKLYIQMILI